MNLRNIIGALMLCFPFAATAVIVSIVVGHWWAGPLLLLLACAPFAVFITAIAAVISVATILLEGDDE